MTKFTATFADGTSITRKTERTYAVAWRATWTRDGHEIEETGFSASPEKVNAYSPAPYYVGRYASSNDRAKAKAKNEAYRLEAGYRVEIVPAVAA